MIKYKTIPKKIIRIQLPDVYQQTKYSCAAAALVSLFNYYDKGPVNEKFIGKELKMTKEGTDPYQILLLLKKFEFSFKVYRKMTIAQLKKSIDQMKPVMIMLQAWKDEKKSSDYTKGYDDGHWIIAVGYDKVNIYFEDPSIYNMKGFIKIKELDKRWHDIEYKSVTQSKKYYTDHYGISIWDEAGTGTYRTREIL